MNLKLVIILSSLTLAHAASKWYTGDNKPYEFGFKLEGNQHRHESKDINGLIMGEFGFITADDVYHVTVYATDENGNYKIISMKNIKLMKMLPPPPTTQAPTTTTSTTPVPFKIITTVKPSDAAGKPACASCKLPGDLSSTSTQSPTDDPTTEIDSSAAPPPFKVVSKGDTTDVPSTDVDVLPQKIVKVENNATEVAGGVTTSNSNEGTNSEGNPPELANRFDSSAGSGGTAPTKGPQTSQQLVQNFNGPQFFNKGNANSIGTYNKAENMLNGLLYKFNYTTDYFGHHEEGDYDGSKKGGYFSIGRDKIKRVVTYKANEFGYQPNIRTELINPDELEFYEQEKENRLKGYNFEWFYPK